MRSLRRFWWRVVRRWNGELCRRCGRNYFGTVWHAADDLWAAVVRDRYGLLCPVCFDDLAEADGKMLMWRPEVV